LADANDSGDEYAETKKLVRKWWIWLVDKVVGKLQEQKSKKQSEPAADKAARRTAIATIWVALFTAVLAVVSYFQWKELRSSGDQTNRLICLYQQQLGQITKQANDTHDLAVAAGKQADQALLQAAGTRSLARTSKDALTAVQRAFIFATNMDVVRVADPSNPSKIGSLEFSITWVNNGTTPTHNMRTYYNWLTPPIALPSDFTYPDLGDHKSIPIALGPRGVAHTTPILVPAEAIRKIMNHQGHLYIWGWATYKDIFQGTKPHITRFCTEVTGFDGDPLNGSDANSKPMTVNCGNNCYDDECKTK